MSLITRPTRPQPRPQRMRWLLAGAGIGALLQYLRDPQQGRTRRVQLKDQAAAQVRRPLRKAQTQFRKKSKLARDRAVGIVHEVTTSDRARAPEDDRVLVDKVRSEVLGSDDLRPYTINVNAVAGVVTLRGQLDRREQINEVVNATADVPGVKRVESFLHLPGEQPPNLEVRRVSH